MRANYRLQRLYCDSPITGGEAIAASKQQAHYLQNVLRLTEAAEILIFNGRDGEWKARLRPHGRKQLWLEPEMLTRAQTPASDLLFCFAPLKTGRLDYLVQKATEMGAGTVWPVRTQHTQQSRITPERLHANIIEAAEQCGILSVPLLEAQVSLGDMLDHWQPERALVFCDENVGAQNPIPVLKALRGRPLGLLVGPEGGFSQEERQLLQSLPFVTSLSLGPRILRADTAAVAALAVIQAAAGDW